MNPRGNNSRGWGKLGPAEQEDAIRRIAAGETMVEVALSLGVTRNTIVGIWHRWGSPHPEPTTLAMRMDRLHTGLDAVLAANVGVGRIVEAPAVKEARR